MYLPKQLPGSLGAHAPNAGRENPASLVGLASIWGTHCTCIHILSTKQRLTEQQTGCEFLFIVNCSHFTKKHFQITHMQYSSNIVQ